MGSLKSNLNPDAVYRCQWIEKRIGQIGVDVRQPLQHIEMLYYLELLQDEIRMTKQFLKEDNYVNPSC